VFVWNNWEGSHAIIASSLADMRTGYILKQVDISGFHIGEYEDSCLLGCETI
jgi:hypothetical protein